MINITFEEQDIYEITKEYKNYLETYMLGREDSKIRPLDKLNWYKKIVELNNKKRLQELRTDGVNVIEDFKTARKQYASYLISLQRNAWQIIHELEDGDTTRKKTKELPYVFRQNLFFLGNDSYFAKITANVNLTTKKITDLVKFHQDELKEVEVDWKKWRVIESLILKHGAENLCFMKTYKRNKYNIYNGFGQSVVVTWNNAYFVTEGQDEFWYERDLEIHHIDKTHTNFNTEIEKDTRGEYFWVIVNKELNIYRKNYNEADVEKLRQQEIDAKNSIDKILLKQFVNNIVVD